MKRRMLRQSSKYACSPHSKKSKPRLSKALLSLFVYTLSTLSFSGASLGTSVPFFIVKTTSELCQSAFEMNAIWQFFLFVL